MVEEGRMREAIDTEVAEIQTRFGSKYDAAIDQMLDEAIRRGLYPPPHLPGSGTRT